MKSTLKDLKKPSLMKLYYIALVSYIILRCFYNSELQKKAGHTASFRY